MRQKPSTWSRRLQRGAALGLVALLLVAPAAWAAVTPIDDYTDPLVIGQAGGTTAIISTTSFTPQGGEPTAADSSCPARFKTGWLSVVGNGLPLTVETDATGFDTVLAVFPVTGAVATPSFGARVGCNDGPGNAATVTFPSQRGQRFLVQFGDKANVGGSVRLKITVTRPANDDRGAAATVAAGTPVSVDQSGATSEAGEVLLCGTSSYAGTVWFRYTATASTAVQFASTASLAGAPNPGDTVLSVYRNDETTPLACNDDTAPGGSSAVTLQVTPGDYFVQVGARGTNTPALGAGPVTLRVGSPPAPVPVPVPVPTVLAAKAKGSVVVAGNRTRFTALKVQGAPSAGTIVVTCKVRALGCPKTRIKQVTTPGSRVSVLGALRGQQLRPGAKVQVTVTQPGFIGVVTTWRIRTGKPPLRQVRCLAPGSSSPQKC